MISTTGVVLPRIKFLLLILWSIVILQPIILPQVLSQPEPTTVTKCYPAKEHTEHRFLQDCNSVAGLAISNPGSFSDLSAWTETPVHPRFSERSDWSISRGICHFSFRADRPISSETWGIIIEDIRVVQQECVNQKGVGGYRIRKKYPLAHDEPGAPELFFSVYIKQLDERASRPSKRVRFQHPGGGPHTRAGGRSGSNSPPIA
jgi:hypothetical protein